MQIHTLVFNPANWMELTQQLSQLDRFDAQWQAIERREKATLKELESIATVRSVGASTRIEGSRLSDQEVAVFIYEFLSIRPFQDGNGRLSRLLATLLLMKNSYVWIEYVSFEHLGIGMRELNV